MIAIAIRIDKGRAYLRLRWPSISFLQTVVLWVQLLVLRIDASRRCIEESLDVLDTCSLQHVERDHGVIVHDGRVVGLNESHSTHIGSQVEDVIASIDNLQAVIHDTAVHEMKLVAEHIFSHMLVLLPIGSDHIVTLAFQTSCKVAGNETTCSARAKEEKLSARGHTLCPDPIRNHIAYLLR